MSIQYDNILTLIKASSDEDKFVLLHVLNARRKYDKAIADTAAASTEYGIDRAESDRTQAIIELRTTVRLAQELGVSIEYTDVL